MLLITECEKKCQSDSDQPQPKRSRSDSREKPSSAIWNLFDELIADSANGDGEDDCGTEAEVMVEMYLKEPVVSHSEHVHPLEYWQSKKTVWPCLAHLDCKYLHHLQLQSNCLVVQVTLSQQKETEFYLKA